MLSWILRVLVKNNSNKGWLYGKLQTRCQIQDALFQKQDGCCQIQDALLSNTGYNYT